MFMIINERILWTANIFGWGDKNSFEEVNGVFQPHGSRVMSFFKDEPIAGSFIYSFYIPKVFKIFIVEKLFKK